MKIENRSKYRLSYQDEKLGLCFINIDETVDVKKSIAKLLLRFDGVREYIEPVDVKKLEEENAKLKSQRRAKNKGKSNK